MAILNYIHNGINIQVYELDGQDCYATFSCDGSEYRTENFLTAQEAFDAAKDLIDTSCQKSE